MKNRMKIAAPQDTTLRPLAPVLGMALLTLALVACGSTPSSAPQATVSAPVPATSAVAEGTVGNPDLALVPYVYDGQDLSWEARSADTFSTLAITTGDNALSSHTYASAKNGWGPVEINRSNGESRGGDGNTLTLNGKTYTSGLGVHSASELVYDLNGQCSSFQTDMGIDDEVRSLGSVTFEIWADGSKLYDSGVMTGSSASKSASVELGGRKQLRLVVTNGGDNASYDHANWAGATLIGCTSSGVTSDWTTVASEWQRFTLNTRSTVRYGVGTSWTQKELEAGQYTCNNELFGDPARGFAKHCAVLAATSPSAPPAPVAPAPATPAAVVYSGPLIITKGGTYSGNWESQNPDVAAVTIRTSEPVIIENSNIRGRGDLITGFFNRLTVRQVNGYGLNPNIPGRTVGKFVNSEEFINVRIENSYAENTVGVYFRTYKGNAASGDTIKVLRNKFKNINGLPSAGNESYDLDKPDKHAHMIHFNDVKRIPNAELAWNEMINEPGKSQVEENINMYVSSGTPSSPILIHDNYIQGAYTARPEAKAGYAGGGIILGDGVANNPLDSGYAHAYNNQIVSTTNQALAIAGGFENHIYNNRAVASGLLPDGRRIMGQNVGIYMWDAARSQTFAVLVFGKNSLSNNYVAWTKVAANGSTSTNPWWLPDCGVNNSTCSGNVSGGKATLEMEKQEYQLWLNKLASNNITIGR